MMQHRHSPASFGKVVTAVFCLTLLLATHLQIANAQVYGDPDSLEQLPDVEAAADAPTLLYCPSGDQCCQYSASAADCASTESSNKGCRSHTACVPQQDPCAAAAGSKSSCVAAGSFCRFDESSKACALDVSQHPCGTMTDPQQCSSSSVTLSSSSSSSSVVCVPRHTCKDICATCWKCIEATRTFGNLPKILRSLSSSGDYTQHAEAVSFFKGFCLSTAMATDATLEQQIPSGCEAIVTDAASSPGLLMRPGALCTRLGMCTSACSIPAPGSSSSSSSSSGKLSNATVVADRNGTAAPGVNGTAAAYRNAQKQQQQQQLQRVDLCSPTGMSTATDDDAFAAAAAAAAATKGLKPGSCISGADCAAGLACDTFTAPECHPTCDPGTGLDRCIAAGRCVDLCERPDVKAAVEESKRRVRQCSSSEGCDAGEECRLPDFPCTMFTCNSTAAAAVASAAASRSSSGSSRRKRVSRSALPDPLQSVPCPAMCLQKKPQMVSARFADDGNSIQVLLNQDAAPVEALCAYIFDRTTSELLGAWSRCTTRGNILTISLAGEVKIRPGQHSLTLSPNNGLLAAVLGPRGASSYMMNGMTVGAPVFTGSLVNGSAVESCGNCSRTAVPVSLMGPSEISVPCSSPQKPTAPAAAAPAATPSSPAAATAAAADASDAAAILFSVSLIPQKQQQQQHSWLLPAQAPALQLSSSGSFMQPDAFTFVAVLPSASLWMIEDIHWRLLTADGSNAAAAAAAATRPAGSNTTGNTTGASAAAAAAGDRNFTSLLEIINATNTLPHMWQRQSLSVPVAALPTIPEGPITISVTINNVFNLTSTSNFTFTKKDSSVAPVFELNKGLTQFFPSSGFRLSGRRLPNSNCSAGSYSYTDGGLKSNLNPREIWEWSTDIPGVNLAGVWGTSLVLTARELLGKVEVGKDYTVNLTARYEGSTGSRTDSITLRAIGSPLSVQLSGPSGTVPISQGNLTFDASGSFDPDDPKNAASEMSYLWGCVNAVDLSPCFGGQVDGVWSIDPKTLKPNQLHTVTLTVAKGSRNATTSTSFTPMVKPTPSGRIQRSCGVDMMSGNPLSCPARHNPSDPLTLLALPDPAYEGAELTWWFDPVATPGVTLNNVNTGRGVHAPALVVMPDALPPGGSVTVHLNMTVYDKDNKPSTGTSSITVPLNSPPYCSSAPLSNCIILESTTATFPSAKFHACATAWADPDQDSLSYEFGVLSSLGPQMLTSGSSTTYTFSSLLPGANTLYVCAVDTYGARSCQQTEVQVLAPRKRLDTDSLQDQILNIDLKFPDAVRDPNSIVDAAMQMASLLTYTAAGAVNSALNGFLGGFLKDGRSPAALGARSGLGNAATTVPALAHEGSVQNATNQVLMMLAEAGAVNSDAEQMNSLVAAAAQLSGSSSVTPAAGRALIELFRAAIIANVYNQRSLTSQQSNAFADALTNGIKAALPAAANSQQSFAFSPQTAAAHQRHLQADGSSSSSIETTNSSSNSTLSLPEAYSMLVDGAYLLNTAQAVVLGAAAKAAGNAGVCVAPALLPQRSVGGFGITFDCPGVKTPAQVALPDWYSSGCSADASCAGNNMLLLANYYAHEGAMAPIIMGVVQQGVNLISSERSIDTLPVSGVVNITLNFTGPGGSFCPAGFQDPACQARIRLPLNRNFDASKFHECVHLKTVETAASTATAAATGPLNAVFSFPVSNINHSIGTTTTTTSSSSSSGIAALIKSVGATAAAAAAAGPPVSVAECLVSQQGLYVVVQWPLVTVQDVDLEPDVIPGAFSEAPIGDNETEEQIAQLYSYTFNLDYRALTSSDTALADFKLQLQKAFLIGLAGVWVDGPSLADADGALKLAYVEVANVRPSSVVVNARSGSSVLADVYFTPPKGTTRDQMAQLAALAPAELLSSSSKLQGRLISAERVSGFSKGFKTAMGQGAIAGIVLGCLLAAAVVVAALLLVPKWRARRAAAAAAASCGTLDYARSNTRGDTGGSPLTRRMQPKGHHAADDLQKPAVTDKVLHYNFMFYCSPEDRHSDGGASSSSSVAGARRMMAAGTSSRGSGDGDAGGGGGDGSSGGGSGTNGGSAAAGDSKNLRQAAALQ